MEKEEIELIVDKKVAEAKFDISEKRLKIFIGLSGAMLTFFGVLLPLWQTNKASDKVDTALTQLKQDIKSTSQDLRTDSRSSVETLDKAVQTIRADIRADIDRQSQVLASNTLKVDNAIQDMQKRFKELEGAHLRKPVLEILHAGQSLEGGLIKFSATRNGITFQVKNNGDAPARNTRIRVYVNYEGSCEGLLTLMPFRYSDEPNYKCAYDYDAFNDKIIDPKETRTFEIDVQTQSIPFGVYPSLLKIFYEQPEPRKYSFSIKYE